MGSQSSSSFSVLSLGEAKRNRKKIVALTCYDATLARLVDMSSVDMVLVGDSVGMVMHGHDHTLQVTMDHMVMHTSWVRRALSGPLLVADLPFMSVQVSVEDATRHASRLVSEGGAQVVKLEGGGSYICKVTSHLVCCGIPVCGHLGFTPQSIHQVGGFRRYTDDLDSSKRLMDDAHRLEDAGVCAMVLEMVPDGLAAQVAEAVSVPVIGIGAGKEVDGQILVLQDLLGMNHSFKPKFVKHYSDLETIIVSAVDEYAREVRSGVFPDPSYSYGSSSEE